MAVGIDATIGGNVGFTSLPIDVIMTDRLPFDATFGIDATIGGIVDCASARA